MSTDISAAATDQAVAFLPGAKREQLLAFEASLMPLPQLEACLKHHFAPGTYAREMFLPADTFIVGKIHKHAHLNIVSRGRVTVVTEFGRRTIDATAAPVTFTSDAGSKRALYVHEDAVWTTIHLTTSTDLAEIEREIIAPDFVELDAFLARARAELESPHAGDARVQPSPGPHSLLQAAAHS